MIIIPSFYITFKVSYGESFFTVIYVDIESKQITGNEAIFSTTNLVLGVSY